MEKMTYNERVRLIAEEMAKVDFNNTYKTYVKYTTTHADSNSWSAGFYRQQWPILVQRYMPFAQIAVRHMAVKYDEGFQFGIDCDIDAKEDISLYQKLIEYGLIPDKTDTNV